MNFRGDNCSIRLKSISVHYSYVRSARLFYSSILFTRRQELEVDESKAQ